MSLLVKVTPAPVRERLVIFVVDMNEKINGHAMEMTKLLLEDSIRMINEVMTANVDDVKFKISILQYGGCNWITSDTKSIDIDDFFLNDYAQHDMKGIKNALTELNLKLDKKEFLKSNVGSFVPVIIFIGSGHTNENIDKEIRELKDNNWYKHAIKLAIITDSESDIKLYERIIGNAETIFTINNSDAYLKIFNRLSYDYTS